MNICAKDIIATENSHILQVYKRLPVVLVRGKGSRVFDANGREYIDLLSGIGVASLGHSHSGIAKAIAEQAGELLHTSNLYFHPFQGKVAERLSNLSGLSRAFFCNSGTEAVEACLKFARRYWHGQGETERTSIIALDGAFHGRTFGSLSVTSGAGYRNPFQPLLPHVSFVSPLDPDQVRVSITDRTAAIIIEPIQGEGGIRPLPESTAIAIAERCASTGTLLISDEVQCGLGRTGKPFHAHTLGLTPDLMPLGKSLGGGVPIGVALVNQKVASAISYGDHGSTYGGNLLACRAALVFLNALEDGLMNHVVAAGGRLKRGLEALASKSDSLLEVRGAGLMLGIDTTPDVADRVVETALQCGLFINRTAGTVIRFLPPLNIEEIDIDEALSRFRKALTLAGAVIGTE